MTDEEYMQLKLDWVRLRVEKLEQMEEKLQKMKQLAEFARDNLISSQQADLINKKLFELQQEVAVLDHQQKQVFWLDAH